LDDADESRAVMVVVTGAGAKVGGIIVVVAVSKAGKRVRASIIRIMVLWSFKGCLRVQYASDSL